MSYASEVLADSPAWYFRFEEPSGAFLDSSPNGVTLAEHGTVTRSVPGPLVTGGVGITATAGWGYLETNYAAIGLTGETFEFWIKTTSTGFIRVINGRRPNGQVIQVAIGPTGFGASAGQVTAFFNDTSYWQGRHTTATIHDGAWHHVVATWAAAAAVSVAISQITIYIDGAVSTSTADSGNTGTGLVSPVTSAIIALIDDLAGTTSIDEAAFYPGALGPDRVTAHFDAAEEEDPEPGGVVEWDDVFVPIPIAEWLITRGASPELTSGSSPGSATIRLINYPDDDYNPENSGSPYFGFLHDGPRVWIGVNEDGTVAFDALKQVYGLFAGRITDLTVLPEGGATVAPFVELVCADPLEWGSRQKVSLPDSTTRSQADLRSEVLDALGWTTATLPVEPATLPLSSADGLALNILDNLNASNGTRHFAKPEDSSARWFRYFAYRRTSGLDGSSDASLDAGSEHLTDTSGWRVSADGIINQQKASVEPINFPGRVLVWQADQLPMTIVGTVEMWTPFGDYVGDPEVDVDYTGSALVATLEPFGETAKLTLASAGTSSITSLDIFGHLVERGSVESVVIDDTASQAEPRGVRAGPDLSGDYLGTIASAQGFAEHIVYRFAGPLYRPTVSVTNWFPEMFDLDLFDRISVTIAELSITDRIFEIVGLTLHGIVAALAADGVTPVVHHEVTYVLQESREQTDPGWFILDDSLLDGTDILAY